MRQQEFEASQAEVWDEYRALLSRLEKPRQRSGSDGALRRFPRLYRRLCTHYALARSRRYGPGLTDDLHRLVQRGYRQLYRPRPEWARRALSFFSEDFPRPVRRHAGIFWLAVASFLGPMLLMGIGCHRDGALIYSLLGNADIAGLESM